MRARDQLRVFFDADVLIAGSVSMKGASYLLIRLSEFGIIRGLTCSQVVQEAERNLHRKVPASLSTFRALLASSLTIVPMAVQETIMSLQEFAHKDDLPILASALENECGYLTTFNVRHYLPPRNRIHIIRPGDLVTRLRRTLAEAL